jgi:hydroxymethylbilane synthase
VSHLIRIAAPGDALGVARAEYVAADLRRLHPGVSVELELVGSVGGPATTDADAETADPGRVTATRLAVLDGRADVAVHALRELPLGDAQGLRLCAVPMRGDPRDVMVSSSDKVLAYLSPGTRIATVSPHRRAQLLRRRSDLRIVPISGGVEARLRLLEAGDADAIVLAAEDLARLGLLDFVTEYFDTDQLIPAPGQAALALEARNGDTDTQLMVEPLNDESTAFAVTAERTCVQRLRANPNAPIGVFALTDGEIMFIHGIVATDDGAQAARLRWTGPSRKAVEVGETLAELLLSAGGQEILAGEPIETIDFTKQYRQRLEEEWDKPYPPEEA